MLSYFKLFDNSGSSSSTCNHDIVVSYSWPLMICLIGGGLTSTGSSHSFIELDLKIWYGGNSKEQ